MIECKLLFNNIVYLVPSPGEMGTFGGAGFYDTLLLNK